MFAAYPLVRKRNAFSTRCGVLTRPSRFGSSPSCSISWRMRSCIGLFYIALFCLPGLVMAQDDPDALYRNRASIEQARTAAALWDARLKANPKDFESAWKRARVSYWLGNHEPKPQGFRVGVETRTRQLLAGQSRAAGRQPAPGAR